jgi:hypothetical protein
VAIEALLNHGHDTGMSSRLFREPTCRRKIYLATGVDQLFHNISMPLLGCNEKRRAPILVLNIDATASCNQLLGNNRMSIPGR